MKVGTSKLFITAAAFALVAASYAGRLETQVRKTYDVFRTAVERHDIEAVRSMLDVGFSLNLPDGTILSRERYLAAVSDRVDISAGIARHKFKLTNIRERAGFVTADVVLTLDSKFRDGNLTTHDMKTVERKSLTWRRTKNGLKLTSIFANEVRTLVDGNQVSLVVRN